MGFKGYFSKANVLMNLMIDAIVFIHTLGRLIMIISIFYVTAESRILTCHQLCGISEIDFVLKWLIVCLMMLSPTLTATVLMLLRATDLVQLVVHTV